MTAPLQSNPCFKIYHPDRLDVPPQIAWTEAQAQGKLARLAAEYGTGFVIAPIPHTQPGDEPPQQEVAAEIQFAAGDCIRDTHSGRIGRVEIVHGTQSLEADFGEGLYPVDKANYPDFEKVSEADYADYQASLLPAPEPAAAVVEPAPAPEPIVCPFAVGEYVRCKHSGVCAKVTHVYGNALLADVKGQPHLIPEANYGDFEKIAEADVPVPAPEPDPAPAAPIVVPPPKKKLVPARPALKEKPAA